jgi:hypothetical protein
MIHVLLLCNILTLLCCAMVDSHTDRQFHNFIGQFLGSNARGFQMLVCDWCVQKSRVPYERAVGVGSVGVRCWLLCWCAVVCRWRWPRKETPKKIHKLCTTSSRKTAHAEYQTNGSCLVSFLLCVCTRSTWTLLSNMKNSVACSRVKQGRFHDNLDQVYTVNLHMNITWVDFSFSSLSYLQAI